MGEQGDCLSCLKPVASDALSLKCFECYNVYHVGKCSGVTKNALKAMSPEDRTEWQCQTCKIHTQRQSTPPGSSGQSSGGLAHDLRFERLLKQNESINQKMTAVLNRMDAMEKSLESQTGKSDALMYKLENQRKTIDGIETAMDAQSAWQDELIAKLESQNAAICDLKHKVSELEGAIAKRDVEICQLKVAVDNAEQYSRRQNIEIHGVSQQPNENLLDILNHISSKLVLPKLTLQDVEAAHRLKTKEGKTAPILVRFRDRNTRDSWAKKRSTLRNERIYINENLTRTLNNLLWETKRYAKDKGYTFTWIRNGKIFVRQKEGSAVIHIESERDLVKIR